jgi:threonine/homoserine/homoserine lactone efflux protein
MELIAFLTSAALISLSGVLSPGPMTAAAIGHGSRSRSSGVRISIGHGLVEVPLIVALYLGAGAFLADEATRVGVGLVGGAFLLLIGWGLVKAARSADPLGQPTHTGRSPLVAGMVLSIGNPYFLLWWATIGLGLVVGAERFGPGGVAAFTLVHWACDLAWFGFLGALTHRGVEAFGLKLYRGVSLACGGAMVAFGGAFIIDALKRMG